MADARRARLGARRARSWGRTVCCGASALAAWQRCGWPRADGAFERTVALKFALVDPSQDDAVLRFRRECDIPAGLEHPYMARLYDAGAADDGTPYLTMEYVEGGDYLAWSDARRGVAPAR